MEKKIFWTPVRRRLLRRILLALAAASAAAVLAVILFLSSVLSRTPEVNLSDISPDGYRTVVLDDAGEEMVALIGEEANREYVTLKEIPLHVQQAFVAIEDERFYRHHGIDVRGILRAAWQNVSNGSLSQGASTLTQQLIKNNVFAVGTGERTVRDKVERKLQEQFMALKLEREAGKDWILENYLNTINLGGGTWGVQTASLRYFGKEIGELTLSEAAVLAAIPKSPTRFNPLNDAEANRGRRELVLSKMLELEMISQQDFDIAMADDVYSRISENAAGAKIEILSYFEDALVYAVLEDLMTTLEYTEEDAWNLLYRGGLTIESTQNSRLQTICEEEINNADHYGKSRAQASIVITDPASGAVKAIVGGRGEKTGSLTLNRAVSTLRQPGSTIKVVGEYATALQHGYTLATVYDDAPYTYQNGTTIRNAVGRFGGMTTMRSAIVASTNVVALKCFQQVGMEAVWQQLTDFGFVHLTEEDRVEALALGGTYGGVTNLEMTAAYNAIAADGIYTEPYYYTRVLDREGKVLLEETVQQRTALTHETAALLTDACEDVIDSGSGMLADFAGMDLAGKSGTTTEMRDIWFVGYSPYYTCGAWCGYDDYSPQESSAPVKKLWKAVMMRVHEELEYVSFDGIQDLARAEICTKCGQLAVEGLCGDTVQGDMSAWEYFVPGTEPTEKCTCHVKAEICTASGKDATFFCPNDTREEAVYLRSGTLKTADATAVLISNGRCDEHTTIWDKLHREEPEEEGSEDPFFTPEPEHPAEPETYPWWHYRNWWRW